MFSNVLMKKKLAFIVGSLALMMEYSAAQADVASAVFSDRYHSIVAAAPSQSQVVYYRLGVQREKAPAAHIYVDEEFHTSLLPGGYTVFCVAPGAHGLNAVFNDAPGYYGKHEQPTVQFNAGETLFFRADESFGPLPISVSRQVAEKELGDNLRQVHVLSRASAVKSCDAAKAPPQTYTLSGDVLFGFGKAGYEDIKADGRKAVGDMVRQLQKDNANVGRVEVVGHTDRLGREAANEALGLRRAQTVRQLLIDNGLPAESIVARSGGSRFPVSSLCSGTKLQLIDCYSPDRRVVLHLNAVREM